jgi:DNA-binding SARP family transcriptional activator/Tfp pilus assembly protein PilF
VQVRLLGPVDVIADGEARPVPGLRRKAILATLALHDGEIVSTDRLLEAVWGEAAPPALNTLQSNVSYLRRVLGSKAAILARPPGYLLDLGDDGTDVRLAERLLRQGTQSADPCQAAAELRGALTLWRGEPLADVAGLAWLEEQAGRLDLLRQQIQRALCEARLAAGEHLDLVPELEQLIAGNPLDEHVHELLILALYRCGRQADALSAYQRLRRTLAEHLGIDPSQALRDLETAILRQDPSLDVPAPAAALLRSAPVAPVPAQLPPAVAAFAGRRAELDSLDTIVSQKAPAAGNGVAVIITAIAGTAGVGKTALAVHWAHRAAAQFPDGQLYANLRGFDPAGPAVTPGRALRGFLEAFAVPPERIPAALDDQVALYRSLLAGKRVLVVLDNARDAEQVRALLPGSPGCLAIVTSRNRLTGLIARDGAYPLSLDVLTPREARELLARRLGARRTESEPGAVEEIITRCARLPLALTVAAARAAANPGFPLAHVAAEIREAAQVLDPFGSDDVATDVRAVFSWSYQALPADAARLFRLLGLHPGPDITVDAAASLAGAQRHRARVLLAELTRGHLLTESRPGRYVVHDLLRAYAAEQARIRDDDGARSAAVDRFLDHCLQVAHAAATLIDPYFAPVAAPPAPRPGVVSGGPATAGEALSWFTAERATLLAAVPLAAEAGSATQAWQLAWALSTYLLRQGLWTEQAAACNVGLDAARRAADTAGEAHALVLLGLGYGPSGRIREATPLLQTALRLLETIGGCHRSQVRAHRTLSWVAEQQERHADMLSHASAALELARSAGDVALEVMSLNDVGYSHALLGNYRQAISYCERSLAGSQEAGERNWESAAWDSLGYIHHQLGHHGQAISCYERSLDLDRELADLFNEAVTLDHLGDVHRSAGDMDAARWAWGQAVRTFDEIGHPGAGQIRAKLGGLDRSLLAAASGAVGV